MTAPTPFTSECDDGLPVTTLRPRGLLTAATAPIVRSSTLKALSGRPELLLVDVSGLDCQDDVVLTLFPALCRQAEAADVVMMLVGPSPTLLADLQSMAVTRAVRIYGSPAEALDAHRVAPSPLRVSHLVLPGPSAGTEVRQIVDRCCAAWGLHHLADPAAVVATELAANAVRHAGTPFVLTVTRRPHHLHIAARDGSTEPPRRLVPSEAGGRGLLIIEGLTTSWGSVPVLDGKVVWATLRLK